MRVFRTGAGLALFGCAVFLLRWEANYFPLVILLSMVAGICLYPPLSACFARGILRVTNPEARGAIREQFTRARALIAQAEYDDAESELRTMLAGRPGLLEGQFLLANLLYENLARPDDALTVALEALQQQSWQAESERLATLAVDICLDRGDKVRAREILQTCAAKAGRSGAAARFVERLAHLES